MLFRFLLPFVSSVQLRLAPSQASSLETSASQTLASSSSHLPGGLVKAFWYVVFRFLTSVLLSRLQVDRIAVTFPGPFSLALLSASVSFLRVPFLIHLEFRTKLFLCLLPLQHLRIQTGHPC